MKRSALKKLNSYSSLESSSSNLVKIGEASQLIGVSIDTLRRWEKRGWLRVTKTPGGTRLYDKAQLLKLNPGVKRGPKLSPLFPTLPKQEIYTTPTTSLFSQANADSQIHLNSDFPILKTSKSIERDQIESEIDNSFSQNESETKTSLFNLSSNSFSSFKKNIQLCIVIVLLALPVMLLTNLAVNNKLVSSALNSNPFTNNQAYASSNLFKKLSGIFSPTLSHALYGKYSAGSPPGYFAKLNNKNSDQLASGRVSGDIKGSNFARSKGDVLADSTPSGSFLQINLDAQINGSLSVDTASVSGALYSSTINTGFGDNEVYPMNQPLLTTSQVTFGGLNLSTLTLTGASNQLTLGNTIVSTQTGGSGAFTVSIPTLSSNGNFVIDNASQTLTNKTISGSDNTITNIPNSALSSSSITINAGSGLSGGGAVSLGGSITLSSTGSTGAVSSITGTADQVIASASTGDIVLSLPQNIGTTSDVEFDSLELTAGLILNGSTSGTVTLAAPSTVTSYTLTLPTDDGTSGYVLRTDGNGNTSWVAQSGGGGGDLQAAYDAGNTILTSSANNIALTLASGLATSTSLTLTNQGTANAFILNDTNAASNISVDIQSGGVSSLTITEAGTVTTTGNISTSAGGTINSDGTLTASDGFTMTTGAIDLTATSGSISATGLTALTYTLSSGTAAITAPTLNLNTASTGNTAVGNATGTFALTSSGLNVSTAGALTGVTSIDTIATSATALTFAGTGTVGATSTALNLQADGSIDVNIAGGNSATGCTITNSNGNLACSGTITANGTVLANYWDRTGTTLSPLTAGDNITTSGNISTSGSGTITSAATLTASNGFTMTTGALSQTSTSGAISSTGLTALTYTLSSGTAAITAPTLNLNTSSTGNTSIGNATGTFALASNGGLNVTTGGALTGVASIDTIAVTATGLTFAGAGTISSTTSSAITLDSGTTGTVNLGTGNNAKTINLGTGTAGNTINIGTNNTVADAINIGSALDTTILAGTVRVSGLSVSSAVYTDGSSNLTTTAPTSGTIGYWSRSGTTLSPATSGDNVTTSGNISTTSTGTITSAGLLTGSDGLAVTGTMTDTAMALIQGTSTATAAPGSILTVGGTVNITTSSGTAASGAVLISSTVTPDADVQVQGIRSVTTFTPSVAHTTGIYGIQNNFRLGSTSSNVTSAYGVYSKLRDNGYTGTLTNSIGLWADDLDSFSVGEVTNQAGLAVSGLANATNNTLALLGTTTIPTGNYSIYSASSYQSYFAGNVGIGDATPSAPLEVGNGTDSLQVSSTGDITFVDANDGASITGPAGGALAVNSSATALNLQIDGSIDVNVAGGSGATGCTVNNTTGDLTCSGTISGGGSVGYWQRSGVTLSPTTSGDNVTTSGNISSTGTGTITSAGTLTASNGFTQTTGALSLTATSGAISATGLTSATLSVTSGTLALATATSGDITLTNGAAAGLVNVLTGNLKVGNGTPGVSLNGEDAYIEGTFEVDGSSQFDGTLTANGTFDANGQFDLGDGGDAGTISATTLDIDATGALQINSSGGAISIGNDAVSQAINIGTGAAARTITIGNNSGASALNFTSGTGAQTYTSSVATGTTTSSAFVYNASSLSSGTAFYLTSSATSGRLMDLNATQTSGTIFNLAYGANTALSGSTTGLVVDLNSGTVDATNQNITGANFKIPTVTDTHTSGTRTLTGMLVNFGSGAGINQNGAGGTLEYVAGDFYMPALTQTAGTLNAYGTRVTTPATITTGGTAYGQYISAAGVGAGSLNGIGISGITGGSGTEYALNIGSGWDAVLRVGSTTVINGSGVTTAVGGGTGQSSYAVGDLLYADTTTTLTKRNIGNADEVLTVIGGVPTWSTISGASCTNCLVDDPTADQTIAPTGQGTTGLSVRQTSTASPTDDIFQVTSSDGSTKYFYVDKDGNVSTAGTSAQTLTLTPLTDTTALTLVGTNVTSQPLQYINSNNASATTGIINMAYGAAQTLTGSVIGFRQDLSTNVTATNQSVTGYQITLPGATNTSGTQAYTGISISGGSINENGGTATTYTGASITIPALTQTSGTLTAYGANVTTPSSITTGGTAYGYNVAATGVGAGTLYGLNISDITGGAGTEVGAQIGSGWDTNLLFNDTTTRVALANGGTLTILDTAGNSLCTITDNSSVGDLSCTGTISGSGSVGYWTRSGSTLSTTNASDNVTVDGTTTANGTFDANGQFDLGDGGDAGTISATTLDIDATGALQINSSGGAISIGNDAVAQNINMGTGAAARTITIGNATGATALAFNSGTGSQTFTSQVQTGTTTTSAFVFDATAITSGTGSYFTSDSITTGKLMQIATTGNTLTSGTLSDIRTTSTALTGTAGTGSLLNLDWTPGSATSATGDLFSLNIGANGSTTGSLFNILDSSASIFSVSETSLTTSLPANFTSPGDVSIAYDLNFTNPVASYIKSYSALTIQPGDPFGSSNLTLSPYNEGSVYIPSNVATAYGVDVDANLLSTGRAVDISSTSTAGGASGASYLLYLDRSGANSNTAHSAYGVYSAVTNTNGTSGTNIAGYFSASGATTANYGLLVAAGNVGIGDTTPSALLEVGDGTDSLQVNTTGDMTFVDANSGSSITGPAGGALAINASATGLNLQVDGAIDVNIAGGSGSTGCTVANATGNLTCSGNISGASTGTIGYWSRSGTTLSTATAGDNVTTSGNISTTGSGTITSAGLLTGSAGLTITGTSEFRGTINSSPAYANLYMDDTYNQFMIDTYNGGSNTVPSGLAIILGDALSAAEVSIKDSAGTTVTSFDSDGNAYLAGVINIPVLDASTAVYTDGSKNLTSTAPTSGAIGYWSRTGTTLSTSTAADNVTVDGTFTANGVIALGDGGDNFSIASNAFDVSTAGALSGITGYSQASGTFNLTAADDSLIDLSAINMNDATEGLILPQNATACSAATAQGQICWDTAGEDLYIGNGATAVQMNGGGGSSVWSALTDPTGDQTLAFGDGEQNIWTISSDTETFWSMTADSMTTGDLFDISLDGLTTGSGFQMQSTSTALTGTAGIGSLMNLEWAPGSSTLATGDLFALNIGANGSTTGNIFNLLDSGSSIFSVSETSFTTSLPSNFTAPGDTSMAYDLNFTNPTAAYIKSAAPLSIVAGETFNSSNLTLGTYNQGTIALSTNNTTTTAVDLTSSTLTTGIGINAAFSAMTTGTGVSITSSGSAQTAGSLLSVVQSGTTTGFTGDVVSIIGSGTTGSGGTVLSVTGANTTAGTVLEVVGNTVTTTNGRVMTVTANALTSGIGVNISSSSNITSGNLLNIAQTGTTTQQAAATVAMSTTATTNASARLLTLTANSMTAGTVQTISSTTTAWGAGTMFGISKTGASGNTAFTGDIANITYSHTFNSTGTLGHTGNVLDMSRTLSLTGAATQTVSGAQLSIADSLTVNNASGTFTYSGDTVSVSRAVTRTSGAITNSGNLMTLTSTDASHTGNTLSIADSATHASGGSSLLITASSITTGAAMTITGPTATGVTGNFVNITTDVGSAGSALRILPDFSGSAVTGYGIRIQGVDSTSAANTDYGIYSDLDLTNNAAKVASAVYGDVSSSSTTADTTIGVYGKNTISAGYTNTAVRLSYGVAGEADLTAANSGSALIQAMYGGHFASNSTGAHSAGILYTVGVSALAGITSATTGSTNIVYAVLAGGDNETNTVAGTASLNYYGVYVENPSMSTTGTTAKYGIQIEDMGTNAADNNYSICFDCDGTYTTSSAVNGLTWGTDANSVNLYRSASNTLTTDDNLSVVGNVTLGSSAASTGIIRLPNAQSIYGRNVSNSGDMLLIGADSSDDIRIGADSAVSGVVAAAVNTFKVRTNSTERLSIASTGDMTLTGSGGTCTMTGAATTTSCGSDSRLKENVQNYQSSLDKLMDVRVVTYDWINPTLDQRTQAGFIAQELQTVFPEFVNEMPNGMLGVSYQGLIMPTIKAIQELNQKVDNALLTINPDGTTSTDLNIQKITVSGDAKIGGLVSASNFALDASLLNRSGAMASVPVSGDNKISLADTVNSLNSEINTLDSRLQTLDSTQASQSAELAQARILGEQAVNHAQTLDEKVASTSANLTSLSSRIDDLLASISGSEPESTDSGDLDLTPPSELIATDSATFANLSVTENLSTLNIDAMDATISSTFKSLGETFLGQTTIAGDLSVDGTLSFTNGNSINAFPTLFFQNNPLASAVDFFNGAITLDKNGAFAAESIALGDQSLGTATIAAGQIEITIPSELVASDSRIFLTPESAITGNIYVGQKVEGSGFKVKLSQPNAQPVKFNWMIVQTKEALN